MLVMLAGGRSIYTMMGGSGATLTAALAYSNVVFSAAVLIWVFNSLGNVVRGTGNMMVPAIITLVGVVALFRPWLGALLRLARRWPAVMAVRCQLLPARCRRRWRLACLALDR
jgi:MatE